MGDRGYKTKEDAARYRSNGPLQSYDHHGYGLYLAEARELSIPIGMCGLVKRENLEYPNLGFTFLPEYMVKVWPAKQPQQHCLLSGKNSACR